MKKGRARLSGGGHSRACERPGIDNRSQTANEFFLGEPRY